MARRNGFTLIEMMVVLLLLALLASIVAPRVTGSIDRAKESTLKEDLFVLRKAIDAYYADHRVYPPALNTLVDRRYIRVLPKDPFTGRSDSWTLVWTETETGDGNSVRGIIDVHSGYGGISSEGNPYGQW